MDLHAKLDELADLIESARAMPMSASCIVNRVELLDRIEELRKLLPGELTSAQQILEERGAVVAEGHEEAQRVLDAAQAERARLVAKTEVVREANREAEAILAAAQANAERMRLEIDDYVDSKLANFEVVLHKTLKAVEKGRAKVTARGQLDPLRPAEADETAFPH